jgi:hypothetical protein
MFYNLGMDLKASSGVSLTPPGRSVNVRCPICGQRGTFEVMVNLHDVQFTSGGKVYLAGQRLCPNDTCRGHLFFVLEVQTGKVAASYPPERIDFDTTNIPASITKALNEAIGCHSIEGYTAAAIMVRKTLEELCHEQKATGGNLKERLRDLSTKIVLPKDLLDGLDDLRLLGNDAAHIESQEFNTVGKEEVEIGIEFAKEVLKATFQYTELLKRLRALKKTT